MIDYTYRFYIGKLADERFICACGADDLMGEPMIGDMIELPIDADITDQELYIVKQRIINDDSIEFFCKLHEFVLEPYAPFVIPRIGERVWLPTVDDEDTDLSEICYEVGMVTYNFWEDGSDIFMVDIDVFNVMDEVFAELNDCGDCNCGGCC